MILLQMRHKPGRWACMEYPYGDGTRLRMSWWDEFTREARTHLARMKVAQPTREWRLVRVGRPNLQVR